LQAEWIGRPLEILVEARSTNEIVLARGVGGAPPGLTIAAELKITFTGGRKYGHPRETTAFNAGRYKWVKKKMERTDVVAGDGETIVYNLGTLYGEWPDGTSFDGNRYVDRFVVRGDKIVQMDVWNDSAERILIQRGITA